MKDFEDRISQRIQERLVREPVYQEDVPAGVIPLSVELPDPGWFEVEW
jgi:hypothetical protein